MNLDGCPCSGRTLAKLVQPAVMTVLAKEPMHGYLIAQRLDEMAMFRRHSPDPTGIYRLLKSMEQNGLVISTWDLADSGPAKRRYELTSDGRACLAKWIETLEDYEQAVTELLETMKAPG
ncbi:MAG: PadR family transcriptional regulator [Phycisphaerae bacterium]